MAKINDTYDIGEAFEAVENELMASMIRNMKKHCIEEIDEKKEWEMWQALQLKSLDQYKKTNAKRFKNQFREINGQIESLLYAAREQGGMEQEMKILRAIKKGFRPPKQRTGSVTTTAEFFKLNDRKLDALIKATQNDFQKAETAVLRMANDQYRKIIYNAQVYANTGAGTYEKAVDMATKDFLSRGINCIEYANGARHTIADYAAMAIQTASKRAYLQGEGEMRKEWGISTVIMNKRGNPCPKCLPFVGKVLIDDVWSGGKASDGPYPLMSSAIAAGLYHPRCKDIHTTYFEGISTPPDSKFTRQEVKEIADGYRAEQKQQYAKRQADRFGRLAEYSLDEENQKKYRHHEQGWRRKCIQESVQKEIFDYNSDIFTSKHRQKYNVLKQKETLLQQKIDGFEQKRKEYEEAFLQTLSEEAGNKANEYADQIKRIQEELRPIREEKKRLQQIKAKNTEDIFIAKGYAKKVKLSEDMSVESVDAIEEAMDDLVTKRGFPGLEEIEYNPAFFKRPGSNPNTIATYEWDKKKIWLNEQISDEEKFFERRKINEQKYTERKNKYQKIWEKHAEELKEELKHADTKERRYSIQKDLNGELARIETTRSAVPSNIKDVLTHEYGHYLHDLASMQTSEPGKKKIFALRELGGRKISGEIIWKDDMKARLQAAYISEYAKESPLEAFAESFTAYIKGEKVPDNFKAVVDQVIEETKKNGIIKENLQFFANKMPDEKFTQYSLNPLKAPDKAKAFKDALGYTVDNFEDLRQNILFNLVEDNFIEKGDNGYGMRYEQILELTGPNGKKAKVLTAWIQDGDDKRLVSVYVDK